MENSENLLKRLFTKFVCILEVLIKNIGNKDNNANSFTFSGTYSSALRIKKSVSSGILNFSQFGWKKFTQGYNQIEQIIKNKIFH